MMKRTVRIALFVAIALIMHFVESALPPLLPFAPGAKMGLSNVVSLIAMVILGYADAGIILVLRCLLASIFGGNISSLMYSLPAGVISLALMMVMYRFLFPKISLMAISFVGAVAHNVAQVFVASLILESFSIMALLPLMLIASVIAGLFIGIVGFFVIKYLPTSVYR